MRGLDRCHSTAVTTIGSGSVLFLHRHCDHWGRASDTLLLHGCWLPIVFLVIITIINEGISVILMLDALDFQVIGTSSSAVAVHVCASPAYAPLRGAGSLRHSVS